MTKEPEVAIATEPHEFEKHASQEHQPRKRENVESLTVFWRSAVAADDGDVGMVLSRYTGTGLTAHCHHE